MQGVTVLDLLICFNERGTMIFPLTISEEARVRSLIVSSRFVRKLESEESGAGFLSYWIKDTLIVQMAFSFEIFGTHVACKSKTL